LSQGKEEKKKADDEMGEKPCQKRRETLLCQKRNRDRLSTLGKTVEREKRGEKKKGGGR